MIHDSEDDSVIDVPAKNFVFFVNEKGDAMHFLLQLRNYLEEKRISTLIKDHFGAVTKSRSEFGPHTIVLVDDSALSWCHDGDVFKVSYIDQCIEAGSILDITKFLKAKSREFVPRFEFMQVVYFKKYSWKTVPDEFKLYEKESEDSDTDSIQFYVPKSTGPRMAYSRKEKEAMLKYIVRHYSTYGRDTLKGKSLYQAMERKKVCNRTWQSMKEHFLKSITKELSSFTCISLEDRKQLQKSLK